MKEIPLFPVAQWDIGTLPALGAMFIRFGFLTHESQTPEQCDPGRRYVLTTTQARELADGILRALRALESAGPQGEPGTRQYSCGTLRAGGG